MAAAAAAPRHTASRRVLLYAPAPRISSSTAHGHRVEAGDDVQAATPAATDHLPHPSLGENDPHSSTVRSARNGLAGSLPIMEPVSLLRWPIQCAAS
jgi:hypothetical protein